MKVIFDTNVILDALLDRKPFSESALDLFVYLEEQKLEGLLCATSLTTISYLGMKFLPREEVQGMLSNLLQIFEVASVTRRVIQDAIQSSFSDFEDAVLYFSGVHMGANAIVTRDPKGFAKAKLPVYSPQQLLSLGI